MRAKQRDCAIGRLLQGLRLRENLTQGQLALRLNVTQSVVSNLEHGRRSLTLAETFAFAPALGTQPLELLEAMEEALCAYGRTAVVAPRPRA